ncbi:MAG: tetratricopeptide repeat protein [Kiritimatiellae bacterium]|nr:tetratricopeptide repeat protein [Kiritimatiellia bacterium]
MSAQAPSSQSPVPEYNPLTLADVLNFIKANYAALAVGVAIVLIVAAGLAMYAMQQRRNAEQASQMLLVAQSPKQWEELLAQHPKAAVAPIAWLALASSQYAAGAYDQALATYGRFLEKYPRHMMALAAELGKIQCQEGRGEIDAAFNGYALFVKIHPDHFLAPQALLGQARCLQIMRRYPEAKVIYEDFIAAHPKSEWVAQAEFAMRCLDRDIRAQRKLSMTNAPAGKL